MDWKKLLLLPLAVALISGIIIGWYWVGVLLSQYLNNSTKREAMPDYAGTLSVEGCLTSAVVQGKDNSFYLVHAADLSKSKYGCPFIDAAWAPDAQNLVIYGHNSSNGTAFSDLVKFRDPDFSKNHSRIRFTNRDGMEHEYVLLMVLDYSTDFLSTRNPYSPDIPEDYIRRMEKFALFLSGMAHQNVEKAGVDIHKIHEFVNKSTSGVDKYITLSTCDAATYGSKGRLIIVGKEACKDEGKQ